MPVKTNNLITSDGGRTIPLAKIAEMNGGFSFRNKIIDGRFDFWYEGVSQSASGYGSDTMWQNLHQGSSKTHSQQPLVAGVDLPAIECPSAKYFSRTVVSSVVGASNYAVKFHRIEDVNTLAGKTVTLSFYAKADSAKSISVGLMQAFGSGGFAAVGVDGKSVALTNQWARYSVQFTIPSIVGKTIGSGSYLSLQIGFDLGSSYVGVQPYANIGQQSGTFDIACIQLEEGSVMTPFEELPIEISQARVGRYFEQQTISGDAPCSWLTPTGAHSQQFMFKFPKRAGVTCTVSAIPTGSVLSNAVSGATNTITSVPVAIYGNTYYLFPAVASQTVVAGIYMYINGNLTINFDARL